MVQAHDYFHTPGGSGISPLLPLCVAPLGKSLAATPLAQQLSFQPFFVGDEPLPLSALAIYLQSTGYASGGRWRIGVYDVSPPENYDVYPKALVHDFGLTGFPTGVSPEYLTTSGAGVTLTNGLYYYATVLETFAAGSYLPLVNLSPPTGADGTGYWPLNDQGGSTGSIMGWYTTGVNPLNPLPATAPLGMLLSSEGGSPERWCPCVFPVF